MRLSLHSLTTLLLVAALPACTATCSVNKGSSSEIPHEHSKPNSGSKPDGKYSGKSKPNSGSTSKPDGASSSKPNGSSKPDANDQPEPEPEPTPQASEPDQDEADPTPPAKPGRAKPKRADPPSPSRNPEEPAPEEPAPVEPSRGSESGTAPMQIDSYGTTPKSGGKVAPPPG